MYHERKFSIGKMIVVEMMNNVMERKSILLNVGFAIVSFIVLGFLEA